jgi:hypothetical protein
VSCCDNCGDCGCGCPDCGPLEPPTEDALVAGLDPDCAGPGGFAVLRGYLGKGKAEGTWRLYLGLELDRYVLLRDCDIVAQRKAGSGSLVWVKCCTPVRYVRVRTACDLLDDILGGQIAGRRKSVKESGLPADLGVTDPGLGDTWDCPKSTTAHPSTAPCCA